MSSEVIIRICAKTSEWDAKYCVAGVKKIKKKINVNKKKKKKKRWKGKIQYAIWGIAE